MKTILYVVGARPNFMKIAPIMHAARRMQDTTHHLIHTGQHYDAAMSKIFFDDLGLPKPGEFLGIGSGSHAEQTAKIMISFEKVCIKYKPSLVLVAGDVNSTLACTLVAKKLHIPTAHVEAGLRSFDMTMPEEVNRVLTDRICDILLTPSPDGDENLKNEGIPADKIFRVGNVMIDSLQTHLPQAKSLQTARSLGVPENTAYTVVTLHRPANVDHEPQLKLLTDTLLKLTQHSEVIFPVHPRTLERLTKFNFLEQLETHSKIHITPPMGYLEFLNLTSNAALVVTDSGGLQEETTALGIPCLTVRPNTERPITITEGTNRLMNLSPQEITHAAQEAISNKQKKKRTPDLWDGHTAERIVNVVDNWLSTHK